MVSSKNKLVAAAPLVVLALAAAACGSNSSSSSTPNASSTGSSKPLVKGKPGGDFRIGGSEPTAIDPFNSQDSDGILTTKALFTQLVALDSNNKVTTEGGVASNVASNTDCTVWTFKLKSGTFTNGEAVDAASFVRGWTRAASKSAASDVAYHMSGIKGFTELNTGTATTLAGAVATDASTLTVTLSAADCEFDKKTLQPVFSPVPTVAGAANNKTYNDLPIGNGAFKMDGAWSHDKLIKMVRNDSWSYGTKPYLDRITLTILADPAAEYDGLAAGTFDYAHIPTPKLELAKQTYEPKGGYIAETKFGINYLLPITTTKPLNSVKAREAISYAIDRDAIISGVFKGFQTKATSLIPPVFGSDYYTPNVCASCAKPDIAKAKQLAQEAGLTPGTEINFMFNTGGSHEEWTQAVKSQLETNLGLKVNYSSAKFADVLKVEKTPTASGLFRAAWGADYPTPDNFLFPLLSTKSINLDAQGNTQGDNRGRYSSPAFDDLLTKERAAKTDAARGPIIKQAEKVAIGDDLALIPLWYRTQYRVYDATKWANVDMDFFEDPTFNVITLK